MRLVFLRMPEMSRGAWRFAVPVSLGISDVALFIRNSAGCDHPVRDEQQGSSMASIVR